jgi:hypothetical protein
MLDKYVTLEPLSPVIRMVINKKPNKTHKTQKTHSPILHISYNYFLTAIFPLAVFPFYLFSLALLSHCCLILLPALSRCLFSVFPLPFFRTTGSVWQATQLSPMPNETIKFAIIYGQRFP